MLFAPVNAVFAPIRINKRSSLQFFPVRHVLDRPSETNSYLLVHR